MFFFWHPAKQMLPIGVAASNDGIAAAWDTGSWKINKQKRIFDLNIHNFIMSSGGWQSWLTKRFQYNPAPTNLMTGDFISIVNVDEVLFSIIHNQVLTSMFIVITIKKEYLRYKRNSIAQEWNKECYHNWQTLKKVFPCLQNNRGQY